MADGPDVSAAQRLDASVEPPSDISIFQPTLGAWRCLVGEELGLNGSVRSGARILRASVDLGPLQVVGIFPEELTRSVASKVLGIEDEVPELQPIILDFVGELVNMIAGQLSVDLWSRNYPADIGLPATSLGMGHGNVQQVWTLQRFHASRHGVFWVSLEDRTPDSNASSARLRRATKRFL